MAFGIDDAVAAASTMINSAINKIWPDPLDKARADVSVIAATADAALQSLKQQMSIALAEAQSPDPWTSRARPSFLYVMYSLILAGIPYAVLWAFNEEIATRMAAGLKMWLGAIPSDLWYIFGGCFSAYTVGRSYEKGKGASK